MLARRAGAPQVIAERLARYTTGTKSPDGRFTPFVSAYRRAICFFWRLGEREVRRS